MSQIHLETFIAAPAEVCFDLCLNVNAHEQAGHGRAVAGITTGQMQLGDTVTWEAVHFLVRQRLTSKIVAYERPHMFVDEMQRGAFRHWRHTHHFVPRPDGTLMIDDVDFAAPLGALGRIAETLILKRYMTSFLVKHNLFFKRIAEANAAHTQPLQPSPVKSPTTELAREA
jgi:ligand-binding SRPBCC domain-containing protein